MCRVNEKKNTNSNNNRRNQPAETNPSTSTHQPPAEMEQSNSFDDQDFMNLLVDPNYIYANDMPGSDVNASIEASNATNMTNFPNLSGMTGLTTQSNQVLLPNNLPSSNQVRFNQPWFGNHGYEPYNSFNSR